MRLGVGVVVHVDCRGKRRGCDSTGWVKVSDLRTWGGVAGTRRAPTSTWWASLLFHFGTRFGYWLIQSATFFPAGRLVRRRSFLYIVLCMNGAPAMELSLSLGVRQACSLAPWPPPTRLVRAVPRVDHERRMVKNSSRLKSGSPTDGTPTHRPTHAPRLSRFRG